MGGIAICSPAFATCRAESHVICRLRVLRVSGAWYPMESRAIVGNTLIQTVRGAISGVLREGTHKIDVECRTPGTSTSNPTINDWEDRHLRIRFN